MSINIERLEYRVVNGWLVMVTPPSWSGFYGADVFLSDDQHRRYHEWLNGDALIQDKLPDLTPDEREVLMTGIAPGDYFDA